MILLFCASLAHGQTIATRVLFKDEPMKIQLSQLITTTLVFPAKLAGTFGLGLVSAGENTDGTVDIEHPPDSNILVFHAVTPQAHIIATVIMEGVPYVLDLKATETPDAAITLVRAGASQSGSPEGPKEVSIDEIKEARLKFDPELLVGFEKRAQYAEVIKGLYPTHDLAYLSTLYPEIFEQYAVRDVKYSSDSGAAKTVVTRIHRFSKEDATVLEGTVTNETSTPMVFDGRAATVQCANLTEPIKLLDCLRPIPPGATVPIEVVIQGDVEGARENLSINNEYRIMLPNEGTVWSLKNGGDVPNHDFPVPKPTPPTPIPLTQTGDPKREVRK
jgi:hypothetical protein